MNYYFFDYLFLWWRRRAFHNLSFLFLWLCFLGLHLFHFLNLLLFRFLWIGLHDSNQVDDYLFAIIANHAFLFQKLINRPVLKVYGSVNRRLSTVRAVYFVQGEDREGWILSANELWWQVKEELFDLVWNQRRCVWALLGGPSIPLILCKLLQVLPELLLCSHDLKSVLQPLIFVGLLYLGHFVLIDVVELKDDPINILRIQFLLRNFCSLLFLYWCRVNGLCRLCHIFCFCNCFLLLVNLLRIWFLLLLGLTLMNLLLIYKIVNLQRFRTLLFECLIAQHPHMLESRIICGLTSSWWFIIIIIMNFSSIFPITWLCFKRMPASAPETHWFFKVNRHASLLILF